MVSAAGAGLLVHNRLTHSLKVAQVARAIAERLDATVRCWELGGCDPDVVEAAALAHDLGHPPFGHLGEQVLDRLARGRLGLADGFEGNAQSFRIVTTIDLHGPGGTGLDLTAAVRAAVLKYPWTRHGHPEPHPPVHRPPPRGAARCPARPTPARPSSPPTAPSSTTCACRAPSPAAPWQQTVEASVMDTADDIAYAIHDLEDFHRVGVLQQGGVAAELRAGRLRPRGTTRATGPGPGGLERLRRRLRDKDGWAYDDDAFAAAVDPRPRRARRRPARRAVRRLDRGGAGGGGVLRAVDRAPRRRVGSSPTRRCAAGHVVLGTAQWHEVAVLKFVHQRFVLRRADLASHQRGQATVLAALVEALLAWLAGRRRGGPRCRRGCTTWSSWPAPRAARHEQARRPRRRRLRRLATDGQATALLDVLTGAQRPRSGPTPPSSEP